MDEEGGVNAEIDSERETRGVGEKRCIDEP